MIRYLKLIIYFLFFFTSYVLLSQIITPFETWNSNDLRLSNSAKELKELSFQEKKVIFYINLARINGNMFVETYLKDYMEDVKIPKNNYYKSLVKTLKGQPRLSVLTPNKELIDECIQHAQEMGRLGKKGHRSEELESFEERIKSFNTKFNKVKESNQYGEPDALAIVIDLLIDDEQESLRHRKMLLDPEANYVGVGIRAHKKYIVNTSVLVGSAVEEN